MITVEFAPAVTVVVVFEPALLIAPCSRYSPFGPTPIDPDPIDCDPPVATGEDDPEVVPVSVCVLEEDDDEEALLPRKHFGGENR